MIYPSSDALANALPYCSFQEILSDGGFGIELDQRVRFLPGWFADCSQQDLTPAAKAKDIDKGPPLPRIYLASLARSPELRLH
jgi:hypothetical protein